MRMGMGSRNMEGCGLAARGDQRCPKWSPAAMRGPYDGGSPGCSGTGGRPGPTGRPGEAPPPSRAGSHPWPGDIKYLGPMWWRKPWGLVLAKGKVRNATYHLQILWFCPYSSPSKITSPGHDAGCGFGLGHRIKSRTPAKSTADL